jgi:cell division protein FtsL
MSRKWMPIWVVPTLIVMAIVTVWLRLSIVRTAYAINQSEKRVRELKQAREDLELKVTALRSPRRLESLARARFSGLVTPRADQVIHLGSHNGQ